MREINITLTFSIFQLSNSVCRNEYFNADYKKDRLERQQKLSSNKKYRHKNDGAQKRPQRL